MLSENTHHSISASHCEPKRATTSGGSRRGQLGMLTSVDLLCLRPWSISTTLTECSDCVVPYVEVGSIRFQDLYIVSVELPVSTTLRSVETQQQTRCTVPRYPDLVLLPRQISSLVWSYPASHAISARLLKLARDHWELGVGGGEASSQRTEVGLA